LIIGRSNTTAADTVKRRRREATPDLVTPIFPLAGEVLSGMPEGLARRVLLMLADLTWWRRGESVRQLEENLLHAIEYGSSDVKLRALSRANMRSFARYQYELSTLHELAREDVPPPINVIGFDIIEKAYLAGNGVVLAVPHMANLEYAGAYLARYFGTVTTVANRFAPERIFESLVEARENLSIEVLSLPPASSGHLKPGSLAAVFVALVERLRNGGLVCLIADYSTGSGVEVELFGEDAWFPGGPATLALYTGAALLPAALWYERDGWSGQVYEAVPAVKEGALKLNAAEMTRALASVFEKALLGHLEDWYITHPLFRSPRLCLGNCMEPYGKGLYVLYSSLIMRHGRI
jgi:lauroyl/myristoyl acyltransferase